MIIGLEITKLETAMFWSWLHVALIKCNNNQILDSVEII
jgi:hypothetical protein